MKLMRTFVNANEMGMGKTVESIVFSDSIKADPVLVVCNSRLLYHWEETAHHLSPHGEFVYASYADVRKPRLRKFRRKYDLIIFDEAHKLKNRRTKQSRGAYDLTRNVEHLALLTGTPVRNHVGELWSLLNIVDDYIFGDKWEFMNAFLKFRMQNYGKQIVGVRNQEKLKYLLDLYMLRRRKEDVMKDLPQFTYKRLVLRMGGKQAAIYRDLETDLFAALDEDAEEMVSSPTRLVNVTRLMQVCASPQVLSQKPLDCRPAESAKTKAVVDVVGDIPDNQQVVVFTVYRRHADILCGALNAAGQSALAIHGGIPTTDNIQRFRQGDVKVLVGTISLLGEGHNLDNARVGIFAQKSWVPAENQQAAARLLRGTTKHSPTILDIRFGGKSIESRQDGRLRDKQNSVEDVVGPSEILRAMWKERRAQHGSST